MHDIATLKEAFRDPLLSTGIISQSHVYRLFTNVDEVRCCGRPVWPCFPWACEYQSRVESDH